MKRLLVVSLFLGMGIHAYCQELVPQANKKGRWGFVNESGEEVVKCQFDEASFFDHDNVAIVKKKNKYGFLNRDGSGGKCKYSSIFREADNYYKVSIGGKLEEGEVKDAVWGYVDAQGKEIIDIKYNFILPFKDGEAYAMKSGKMGIIRPDGTAVIDFQFTAFGNFNENNHTWVNKGGQILGEEVVGGKWGIMDKYGTLIVAPNYVSIGTFTANDTTVIPYNSACNSVRIYQLSSLLSPSDAPYYWASPKADGSESALFDINGSKLLSDGEYLDIYPSMSDVVIGMKKKRSKSIFYYYDLISDDELEAKFILEDGVHVGPFYGDKAMIYSDHESYLIDKSSQRVSDYYDMMLYSKEGFYYAEKGGLIGLLKPNGDILIPFDYKAIDRKLTGDILVAQDATGKCGAINLQNEVVIPFEYDAISTFYNNVASAKKDGRVAYIDANNNALTGFDFLEVEDPSIKENQHYWVKMLDSMWHYYDIQHNSEVFAGCYKEVSEFSEEGISLVQDNNSQYGIIQLTGDVIMPFQFETSEMALDALQYLYGRFGLKEYTDMDIRRYKLQANPNLQNHTLIDVIPQEEWDY